MCVFRDLNALTNCFFTKSIGTRFISSVRCLIYAAALTLCAPGTQAGIHPRAGMMSMKLPPGSISVAPEVALSSAALIQGSSRDLASYPYMEDNGIAIDSLCGESGLCSNSRNGNKYLTFCYVPRTSPAFPIGFAAFRELSGSATAAVLRKFCWHILRCNLHSSLYPISDVLISQPILNQHYININVEL